MASHLYVLCVGLKGVILVIGVPIGILGLTCVIGLTCMFGVVIESRGWFGARLCVYVIGFGL